MKRTTTKRRRRDDFVVEEKREKLNPDRPLGTHTVSSSTLQPRWKDKEKDPEGLSATIVKDIRV